MAGIFLPGSSKPGGGDITSVVAGVGLSGGATADDATLSLDLSELSAVVPTSGDWFATLDSDEANEQLTTTDALATLFAGDGLTASSAVLAVNVDDSTIETSSDAIRIKDNAVSLAKMAGITRGSIIYGDTNGDPAALAKGNANYVLTSDGTDIAWAAAAAGAADDITAGDGAVSIETTSGNITIDAQANDADVIIKVDDAGASVTAVTFDGSDEGNAIFVNDVQLKSDGALLEFGADLDTTLTHTDGTGLTLNSTNKLTFGDAATFIHQSSDGVMTIDGEATIDLNASTAVLVSNDLKLDSDSAVLSLGGDDDATLTHDGTTGLTVAANPFEVDSGGNITLDAHTGIFIFQDANTEVLRITEGNSGDVTVKLVTNAKDLIFTDNGDATGLTIKDAAAGIVVPGEVMTTKVSYTDGDDAMTIADGGGVTFPVSIDITGSAGIILENDETITNSTNGTISFSGGIAVPDAGNIGSASDLDAIAISSGGVVTFSQSVDHTLDAHFDSSPADETVSGITATFTAGEDLVRGEVVYFKAGDSKMWKAVASAAGTMPVAAMAAADISADATGKFLLFGFLQDNGTFPAYTVGADLYAPEAETSSQNVPEEAAPDSDGDFVQVVGYAVTANSVFFNPDQTIVEVA